MKIDEGRLKKTVKETIDQPTEQRHFKNG